MRELADGQTTLLTPQNRLTRMLRKSPTTQSSGNQLILVHSQIQIVVTTEVLIAGLTVIMETAVGIGPRVRKRA
jgi:hypothetical protein